METTPRSTLRVPPALEKRLVGLEQSIERVVAVVEQLVEDRDHVGCAGGERLVHLTVPSGVAICAACVRRVNRGGGL